MRSFSLVLLRRLLFRPSPQHSSNSVATTLYDHLSAQTLATLERLLLQSVAHEPVLVVRRKAADTVSDVANHAMRNGRPWHALQTEIFKLVHSSDSMGREIAYRVFTSSPNIILDLQVETVLGTLQRGLEDRESIDVCRFHTHPSFQNSDPFSGPTSRLRGGSRLSYQLRRTSTSTVFIPHVSDTQHPSISPPRSNRQVPLHTDSLDHVSRSLHASSPRIAILCANPFATFCRSWPDTDDLKTLPH